jgi:hypothetical protein
MGRRFNPDKFKSQIVFDITGGEKTFASMTMSTFPNQPRIVRTGQDDLSLRTDDIEGAQVRQRPCTVRDTQLNITDIEGTRPTPAFDRARPPVDVMACRDIDGTCPRIHRDLPHSHRHTNPLTPEYQLPTKVDPPPPEIPFVYDAINFDDIEGVHPRTYKTDKPPRDVLRLSDIPGTRPRPRIRHFDSPPRDLMAVSDINNDGKFRTARCTDPLWPVYHMHGTELGADYGTAQSNYLERRDGRDLSLTTGDIDGATATPPPKPRAVKTQSQIEEEDEKAGAPLMLPSMHRQTAELERQRAIDGRRSERIWRFEHRHLQKRKAGDRAQDAIRSQRANPVPGRMAGVSKIEL